MRDSSLEDEKQCQNFRRTCVPCCVSWKDVGGAIAIRNVANTLSQFTFVKRTRIYQAEKVLQLPSYFVS